MHLYIKLCHPICMGHLNIEFKARCEDQDRLRAYLQEHNAKDMQLDHQIDTYFNTSSGRLKLREGNIEKNLIYYKRSNQKDAKASEVVLYRPSENISELKNALTHANGVQVVVDKVREIYFIENVKFHIDSVKHLGQFMEVEAIDLDGDLGEAFLKSQCEHYKKELGILEEDLIAESYSDMILAKG